MNNKKLKQLVKEALSNMVDEIDAKDYSPIMIADPYSEVFDSLDWKKDCEKWYFIKN